MECRILIAEDDSSVRALVAEIVKGPGRRLVLAVDGKQALSAWSGGGYRLLLLDNLMPGCTGLDVLRRVRESGDGTPAILMSATFDAEVTQQANALGGVECLAKPFGCRELRDLVEGILAHP